jgi:hypothetical protein
MAYSIPPFDPPSYESEIINYSYKSIIMLSIIEDIKLFISYNKFYIFINNFKLFKNIKDKSISSNDIIIKPNAKLLYTPVAKNYNSSGPCSKKDWNEQLNRYSSGEEMMWDDSKTNSSKCGDVFATCFNGIKVEFYIITDIKSPHHRLPNWCSSIGQANKNVIYIKPLGYTMDWTTWIKTTGYSNNWNCQGTKNAGNSPRKNIISYLSTPK